MEYCSAFIVKKSSGELWYFFYEKSKGIVGINFCNNKIKNNLIAAESAIDNFTVYINSKDEINIFYEDINGSISVAVPENNTFKNYTLFKRKSENHEKVQFQVAMVRNNIYLFYSISNEYEKDGILVYQTFSESLGWSRPNFIDTIYIEKNKSFSVLKQGEYIFIFYVKHDSRFTLVYRILNTLDKRCSERTIMDYSDFTFLDYEMLLINNSIHGLYIKSQGSFSSLIYTNGSNTEISRQLYINSCAVMYLDNEIYLCWNQGKKLNYINSSEGSVIKTVISPGEIIKAGFISNYSEDKNNTEINSIYIYVKNYIPIVLFADLYIYMGGASDDKYTILLKKFQQKKYKLIKAESEITLKSSEIYNLQQIIKKKDAEITLLNSKLQQLSTEINRLNIIINELKEEKKPGSGLFGFFKGRT
ncbi:hypothetical protein [Clostridium sp. JN-9]|uniref:hypothetical protein n=1 Tax=Clostridium sp. JN-9 TaxID=2507159 RepID=UPI000FFDF86C|nr:hypothetical protein [Clostridium sp. JN-9]QAT41073.1 hypothetical protein EQM05_12790 [Clostridium sp. JN-9]